MKKFAYNHFDSRVDQPISEAQFIRDAYLKGGLNAAEHELIDILKQSRFQSDENLHWKARCIKSYENASYLMRVYPLSANDIKNQSDRLFALHEWVTMVDGTLMTILTIHYNLCLGTLLANKKSTIQHAKTIEQLLTGKFIGAFLATELGYGNNVMNLQTTAIYNPKSKSFRIYSVTAEARKFMPNTAAVGVAKQAIVLARLKSNGVDHGVFPFVVQLHNDDGSIRDGVRITPLGEKAGYDLDNAITDFRGIEVPHGSIVLDDFTDFTEAGVLSGPGISHRKRFLESIDRVQVGKLVLAAAISRGMSLALKICSDYLSNRKTFAPRHEDIPIIQYNHIQKHLSQSIVKTVACRLLHDFCKDSIQSNRNLAILKIVTTQHAQEVLFHSREKIGAQGLFSKNKILPFLCQLPGLVTAEGDNDILLIRMAREILMAENYRLPRINWTSLLFSSFQKRPDWLQVLAKTEIKIVIKLRLQTFWNLKIAKKSILESWNDTLVVAMGLARLHSYRISVETFNSQKATCHQHIKVLTQAMENLYLLNTVEKFLPEIAAEVGISSKQVRALNKDIKKFTGKISAKNTSLIASFDLPTELAGSPLIGNFVENYTQISGGFNGPYNI